MKNFKTKDLIVMFETEPTCFAATQKPGNTQKCYPCTEGQGTCGNQSCTSCTDVTNRKHHDSKSKLSIKAEKLVKLKRAVAQLQEEEVE
jgi:hypothetical protein